MEKKPVRIQRCEKIVWIPRPEVQKIKVNSFRAHPHPVKKHKIFISVKDLWKRWRLHKFKGPIHHYSLKISQGKWINWVGMVLKYSNLCFVLWQNRSQAYILFSCPLKLSKSTTIFQSSRFEILGLSFTPFLALNIQSPTSTTCCSTLCYYPIQAIFILFP